MIILGSTSPRRKELLKKIVSDFKIVAPSFNEREIALNSNNYALVEATNKALSLKEEINDNDCLICVDTIVILAGRIYGKPKNSLEAFKTLKELSNKTHEVISGYYIKYKDEVYKGEVSTKVTFNNLSDELITKYITEVNVFDKAGSYAVQDDKKYHLIKSIDGSYYNVMGFPLEKIEEILKSLHLI